MHIGVQYQERDTALVIQPVDKNRLPSRDLADIVEEAEGLARAIDLNVLETQTIKFSNIQAGSFFGKGIRAQIAEKVQNLSPSIIIVNCALSPVQQRNLEKEWNAKIIDRTGLILEIFGARAQTKEGRLQVELAALDYQRSRLVRSWTHLERQRGGAGFMGGPGERQIELDRRMISQRITRLKKELDDVRRTRDLGRQSRERVPFPIVSLVGYTNAGKSTLFNHMTNADVFAEDLPFATLDPTMRKITLPSNQEAILADTVGFISDLPTHLIAAFRATLEQIIHADVILHVIDISRKGYMAQKQDVISILSDLGVEYDQDERIIEVLNKADQLPAEKFSDFERDSKFSNRPTLLVSAIKEQGIDTLQDLIAEITSRNHQTILYSISIQDGKALSWLYQNGEVLDRSDSEQNIQIEVSLANSDVQKFQNEFSYMPVDHN